MARPALVPAATLVEDLDFYPRASVDSTHVSDIVHAMNSGLKLPPVIADRKSKRLVDGWHRRRATLKHFGPSSEIEVFWRDYASDAEMYEDAVQLNASHGRKLTSYDRVRITLRCQELGISLERVPLLIHRTSEDVKRLTARVAHNESGEQVPLKRPFRRFAGTVLTPQQEQVNRRSSGWSVGYHAQQLIENLEVETATLTPELILTLIRLRDVLIEMDLDLEVEQ